MLLKKNNVVNEFQASKPAQGVIALARGLEILQCFSVTCPELGSAELARLTGLPQPTVWRLCQTLLKQRFMISTSNGQRMQLGSASVRLGIAASASFNALEIVRPRMQFLADRYKASVSIATSDRLHMVYLERCAAEVIFSTNMQKGSRLPIHKCTLGWAYLATLEEHPRNELLHKLREEYPKDNDSINELAVSKIKQYRLHGFVLQRGLVHRRIIAVAIPILTPSGSQFIAINCSADIENLTQRQLKDEVEPQLREIANILGTMFLNNKSLTT